MKNITDSIKILDFAQDNSIILVRFEKRDRTLMIYLSDGRVCKFKVAEGLQFCVR